MRIVVLPFLGDDDDDMQVLFNAITNTVSDTLYYYFKTLKLECFL